MKKLLLVLGVVMALAVVPMVVLAQTWFTTNQATVAWDAVAPIVATDVIKYQVYTRIGTTGNGAAVGGEITATQLAITFAVEGRYFIGVKSIRYPVGETVGIPSAATSWSNDPLVCAAAGPFGIVYYVAPAGVRGMRTVP
jgi:hypothetical protein